jgi:hypothetical protein
MKTTVINVDKLRGGNAPEFLYIGRGSIWGNPHHIDPYRRVTREKAIALYEAHVRRSPELLAALPQLVGKRLGCHCKPLACHGDVLVRLIEEFGLEQRVNDAIEGNVVLPKVNNQEEG